MQELALLTNRISDSVGALPVAMEPVEEELAAAQQRLAESSVEVQRLTAVAAACREEVCLMDAVHSSDLCSSLCHLYTAIACHGASQP